MIEKLHKNAFVEKYPSGHMKKNYQICKKYMSNSILTYENIHRCINTNFTYSLHVIKKIIIEFVTEYHIQCCSEFGRRIFERKESIYKGNRWNWRRWYNRYDKHMIKILKIMFQMKNMYLYKYHKCNIVK